MYAVMKKKYDVKKYPLKGKTIFLQFADTTLNGGTKSSLPVLLPQQEVQVFSCL